MYYYLVWVRSSRYHGSDALTYASPTLLKAGTIIQVPLQKETVPGVVVGTTSKPRFQTKELSMEYGLPPVPGHALKLATWLKDYYPAPLGIITQQILPAAFSPKQLEKFSLPSFTSPSLDHLPPLTEDQATALETMVERNTYLLHGRTGSGKTRIYMDLAYGTLQAGRSAIILTPEISLTSQLAANFREVFGERVVVIHSQQTPSERLQAWLTCLHSTEPLVVIGARSALFSPLQKLGLIVIDESHESAYKQEQAPQYVTSRVAAYLAGLTRATLVLGSATPAVADYYLAEQKQKPILTLSNLARPEDNPGVSGSKITIIDRKEHDKFNRSPFMSLELIKAVETALARGEQSLLYLNRRGTARIILCENCGWQAACPHCDVPLTYHGDSHNLRCHSCNFSQKAPSSCPACSHPSIIYKSAGTKAIAEEVERLFPNARVARFDTDNAKAERFEQHYEAVKRGEVDILVGTQLLAKGLDLPKLSTLGILLADTSLYMPDFTSQERTFQLISQVLGRIGRGHVKGQAIIQTYHPEHAVLRDAIEDDYQRFYERELEERKLFMFPPYCYLLKLTVRRASVKAAEAAAEKFKADIETSGLHVRVEGPAPAFYERFKNKFQWQLVVKAKNRSELLRVIERLPANWSYDIDPLDLL
jgi:primosomal protein N' (replication factor Y) (superfamily II helicase)